MKGSSAPTKKGAWNKFTTGVMVLVVLSLFVPFIFSLGGLHSKIGYPDDGSEEDRGSTLNPMEDTHVEFTSESGSIDSKAIKSSQERSVTANNPQGSSESSGSSMQQSHNDRILHNEITDEVAEGTRQTIFEESDGMDKSCEERFGSYCLWCREHKEVMEDSMVKKMKDRLFMARSYYPSIAKKNQTYEELTHELKQNIQEFERVLSDATTDADLQSSVEQKIQNMEASIAKAEAEHVGCYNVDKKLAQILDMTKDEALFHRHQSAFLYHLGVQAMPKSHHCLTMRLTVEYFRSHTDHEEHSSSTDHPEASGVQYYVIFSKNIIASSVVINSTITNAKENVKMSFYLITDAENYFAMKHWFIRNQYKFATIQVENIDKYKLKYIMTDPSNVLHLTASEEFRVTFADGRHTVDSPVRTEYLSMFSSAYFYLPEIFSQHKKVVVLDDDVVVQSDLSHLWDIDMQGKVVGVLRSCRVRFGHLKGYVKSETWDENNCIWTSGVSMVDLERWRELHLFEKYQGWLQTKMDLPSFRIGAFSANLVTFNGLVYDLDDSLVLSDLGYKYGIDSETIKSAAILHYNGNMKPWLEMGIPQYKQYWKRFLKKDDQYMDDCNVNR